MNESAFPYNTTEDEMSVVYSGMSLRDWFAGQAMKSCLPEGVLPLDERETAAQYCYAMADAILKVLRQVGLKPYLADLKPLAVARVVKERYAAKNERGG